MTVKKYGRVDSYTTGALAKPYVAYKSTWKHYKDTSDKKGTDKSGLIILNPATDRKDTLKYIDAYSFNQDGTVLLMTSKKDKKDSLSVTAVMIAHAPACLDTLAKGAESYSRLTLNDAEDQLVFLGSKDKSKNRNKPGPHPDKHSSDQDRKDGSTGSPTDCGGYRQHDRHQQGRQMGIFNKRDHRRGNEG